MSEKMIGISPIEYSFKNKGTAKTHGPSFSANSIGAESHRSRRSWSWDDRGCYRDLQRKSKSKLGVLRQDPPTLKSVLCFNKNGVLEQKFWQSFEIEFLNLKKNVSGDPYL